jgi:hypothetical protein
VALSERDRHLTLARVGANDQGAKQWLLGGSGGDVQTALLAESEAGTVDATSGRSAQATVTTGSDAKAGVAARYGYTSGAGGTISFWYALGSETRFLAGTAVDDGDVEIYGQA